MRLSFLFAFILALQNHAFPYKELAISGALLATQAALASAASAAMCNGPYTGIWENGEAVLTCATDTIMYVSTNANANNYCSTYRIVQLVNGTLQMLCSEFQSTGGSCLTPDLQAYTITGDPNHPRYEKVPLKALQIGDAILDARGKPTAVVGFLHKHQGAPVPIIRFYTQRAGEEVLVMEATPMHLLLDGTGAARYAQDFQVSDALLGSKAKPVFITRIEVSTAAEVIAPLTEAGTMLVGAGSTSVGVSCYAHVPHRLAHLYEKGKRACLRLCGIDPHPTGEVSVPEQIALRCLQTVGVAK